MWACGNKVPISCTQVIAEPRGDRGLKKTILENRIKVEVATEKRWGWGLWVCMVERAGGRGGGGCEDE